MPDGSLSLDPVVESLAIRRERLATEVTAIDAALTAYFSNVVEPETRRELPDLDHFDLLDGPECGCETCMDWELRRKEFESAAVFVPAGHKWTICGCKSCRFVGRLQLNFLAATNRRDLLIEMSYHARHHSMHGPLVMQWLRQEMKNASYTVNWCAQEMGRYPLERWMKRCESAVSGIVSGAVFRTSAMATAFTAAMHSSLLAETDSRY